MFVSFFPRPRLFLTSAALWSAFAVIFWYAVAKPLGEHIGFAQHGPPVIGIGMFWTGPFLWFELYYLAAVAIFAGVWRLASPHPWWRWSVLGSGLILLATYLQVEVNVGIVNWYGPFWNMVQDALDRSRKIAPGAYYAELLTFLWLGLAYVTLGVGLQFVTSHYIFRWRTAMNDYYVAAWTQVRSIEGASQRIQEDTMRFSSTTESLGLSFIGAIMTLIAFTPVLLGLSTHITRLPLVGDVPYALLWVAILWSLFGTAFLALVGVRLPGLEFKNQRVEAAYRKELVYGEDNAARARPPTLAELFAAVRKNYFTLYFHFVYFNIARICYLQVDAVVALVVLGPTILAGAITFGVLQQILGAFQQVRGSFQYLVNAWTTIVELQSIYKRLRAFEALIRHEPLPGIEGSPGAV
ncbi:MAG TPA: peptide antibiotic transporter SbmA [Caulobacteraceae bacterium]|nr:peptide antibiotic transporter SbmA [Caulobacteraceae bacterium]